MSVRRAIYHPLSIATALVLAFGLQSVVADMNPWVPMKPTKRGTAVAPAAGDDKPKSPYKAWGEVLEDTEAIEGVFTIHKKRESHYLELAPEHFEKDYMIALSVGSGIGERFLFLGGMPLGQKLVNFRRVEDHVELVEPNTRFVSERDSALANAVELSYGPSVIATFDVESEQDSTGAVLVDLGELLLSDYPDLGFLMGLVLDTGVGVDRSRTRVSTLKNFPQNLEVDVDYSLTPMNRRGVSLSTVMDTRFIPIQIHYSIIELPDLAESDYVPRYADARVGYFMTVKKDFSEGTDGGYFKRFVDRWHLVKKDPNARVSEPVEPIVYYIDRTIPEELRPYVREGIEGWQPAFEAAGFKNAIVARDYPEDNPDFDPEDVRYSTIRWITSSSPSFGAIGPHRADPRTGRTFDSDILFEASFVQSIKNGFSRFVTTRELDAMATAELFPLAFIDPELRRILEAPGTPESFREQLCLLGPMYQFQADLLGLTLLTQGRIQPGEDVPIEYVGELLRETVMHEVGHALGLRHNFKSSTDIPFEKLNDRQYVEKHGLTGSVMDYAPPNIALDPAAQGYYASPGLGTYDTWAIRYGYTPFGADHPDEEIAELEVIAIESSRPGHTYATDEDTYPASAIDPGSNIFDLGSDPLSFAEERCALTDRLIQSPDFAKLMLADGDAYPKLRRAMQSVLMNRFFAVSMAYKYLGGGRIARDNYGQPGGRAPVTPIPGGEQRRALRFIFDQAFQDDRFEIPSPTLDHLAIDRWTHWGSSSWGDRFDFPLHNWVSFFHTATVRQLTAPTRLQRMLEAELKYDDTVSMAELFDALATEVWRELESGGREVSSFRRNLQRVHLDRMIAFTIAPPPGTPADAQALARLHLQRLQGKISRFVDGGRTDDTVLAHLRLAQSRIEEALDANLETSL